MKKVLPVVILALFLLSCQSKPGNNTGESEKEPVTWELSSLWSTDTVLKTPESVLYDPARDLLFVANINGNPTDKDSNGFITKLGTDGSVIELEWVTGLHAPKGMGVYEDLLFVADIDHLVVIDIPSATIKEKVSVEKAQFLNDVTVSNKGKVYFSDMRTGKIHTWYEGELATWKEGLEGPNGLYSEEDRVMLLTNGKPPAVKTVSTGNGEVNTYATGISGGDGIEFTGLPDTYVVSDWSGQIFLVQKDTTVSLLNTREEEINSADIGFNKGTSVVYVPTFFDNRVVAYKLEKN